MPGKPQINIQELIKLKKEGKTNGEIARNYSAQISLSSRKRTFSVSAIGKLVDKAIKKGLLPESMRYLPAVKENREPSLDEVEEYLISIKKDAAETKVLRNRLASVQNDLYNCQQELKILKEKDKRNTDKKQRWELAKQQGEINGH